MLILKGFLIVLSYDLHRDTRKRLGGAACGTACGLAGCDKRSRRPSTAFCLIF